MSWDIIVTDLPADVQTLSEIAHDFQATPLGKREDLIARIQQILPEVDFSNRSWGVLAHPGFSIHFNMGKEEVCNSFKLQVRGGEGAVATIVQLLDYLKLRAVDCQTSEFFSAKAGYESLGQWQAYNDRVMGLYQASDENR